MVGQSCQTIYMKSKLPACMTSRENLADCTSLEIGRY